MKNKMKNKMKKTWIISAVAITLAGAMVCKLYANKQMLDERKEVKTEKTEIAVTAATASVRTIDGNLKLVGAAEASRYVSVASEVSGKIMDVHFQLGDFVKQGAVLVQVDDAVERLAVETAQLNFDKFGADLERYKILREGDAVSETQLRDVRFGYETARIQLENARKQLSDTRLTAPFSGYITQRNAEQGALVAPGTVIASIADVSELKIKARVSENSIYTLRQGQEVEVAASVYPQARYRGRVSNIGLQSDNAHTFPVEIITPNSREYPLKSGTYVNMTIRTEQELTALMIPRDAIISSIKEPSVYVIENGAVKLTKIAVGRDAGAYIEILSGLQKNDRVVVNGQINLIDGTKITVN
jgi:RND family efflux transporter MFP subunit